MQAGYLYGNPLAQIRGDDELTEILYKVPSYNAANEQILHNAFRMRPHRADLSFRWGHSASPSTSTPRREARHLPAKDNAEWTSILRIGIESTNGYPGGFPEKVQKLVGATFPVEP
jgi:hypothetical protein